MTRTVRGHRGTLRSLGRLALVSAVTSVAVLASTTTAHAGSLPEPTPEVASASAVLDDPAVQQLRDQFAALPEGGEMSIPLAEGSLTVAKQDGVAAIDEAELARVTGTDTEASAEEPALSSEEKGASGAANTCKKSAIVAAGIMLLGAAAIAALLLFSPGGAVIAGVFLSAKALGAAATLLGSFAALELYLANFVC
jgi:hypothetical protein